MELPRCAQDVLVKFEAGFSQPTAARMLVIVIGIILARGKRTITNAIWAMGDLATGDWSDYHRLFSRAPWKMSFLGRTLARMVIDLVPADQHVVIALDDTLAGHKGPKVYGKGCHHDAVRSTRTHVVWKWGHCWVVLAVAVRFPFCSRPWALPVLCALYKSKSVNEQEGRVHKTRNDLARQLFLRLLRWFPNRKFVLVADGAYSNRDLAATCHRYQDRAVLIGKFPADAALYDPPPKYSGTGRPRVKGRRRRSPRDVIKDGGFQSAQVKWYGCTDRTVRLKSASAHWHKPKFGLIPIHWVYVRDDTGTRRDEYYFCTKPGEFTDEQIVSYYTQRWTIEVTFQEVKCHLGFETPRQRVANSVLKMAPLLLATYTLVSLMYHRHVKCYGSRPKMRPWYSKTEPTFADALETVRRQFWQKTVFQHGYFARTFHKTPTRLKTTLINLISQAS